MPVRQQLEIKKCEERIRDLLHWDQLISTMEALVAFSLGRMLQPVRNMLTIEEGKASISASCRRWQMMPWVQNSSASIGNAGLYIVGINWY
jgi:hypothetical protein